MPEKLSQHDGRLLSGAIGLALVLIDSGRAGREALNFLGDVDPRVGELTGTSLALLSRSVEGMLVTDPTEATPQIFEANVKRVRELGVTLLGKRGGAAEVEFEPGVDVLTDIDKGGTETGLKRYALWLTHDEIHLVHWALKAAEAVKDARSLAEMQENTEAYTSLRDEVIGEPTFDAFVTRFDNIHRQARIDDGEEDGVKSAATPNPETPKLA